MYRRINYGKMALRKIPMTMQDWEARLNKFIEATDRENPTGRRKSDCRNSQSPCRKRFEKYRIVQDRLFESDFDLLLKQLYHKDKE